MASGHKLIESLEFRLVAGDWNLRILALDGRRRDFNGIGPCRAASEIRQEQAA